MAQYKKETDTISLNNDTKIIYEHKYNKNFDQTKFIIENIVKDKKKKQIIIDFYKTNVEYDILVYSKDKNSDQIHNNQLLICNDTYSPMDFVYERLNLKSSDGMEIEQEPLLDLNEQDIFDEIFFILDYSKHFKKYDVERSFHIITPLIKDLIKDFINYKSENILCSNKKLVKKN